MKQKTERLMLTVGRGVLTPADDFTMMRMREKGYHVGDVLSASLKKPRNYSFHKKVHALGQMIADNVESFAGMTAHKVLKRLQLEANIGCEEVAYTIPGCGMVTQRIPRSLSYADMEDGEFAEVYEGFCKWVCANHWPELEPYQVEEMAQLMNLAA